MGRKRSIHSLTSFIVHNYTSKIALYPLKGTAWYLPSLPTSWGFNLLYIGTSIFKGLLDLIPAIVIVWSYHWIDWVFYLIRPKRKRKHCTNIIISLVIFLIQRNASLTFSIVSTLYSPGANRFLIHIIKSALALQFWIPGDLALGC